MKIFNKFLRPIVKVAGLLGLFIAGAVAYHFFGAKAIEWVKTTFQKKA